MDSKQIWQDFRQRLQAFIRVRVRTEHDAEDILQDVFVKVHQNISSLKDGNRLEAWLFRLTRNTITDYYRRSRPIESIDDDSPYLTTENPDETDLAIKELARCIKPLLQTLPIKYRHALETVSYKGQTQQALADELNLSLSAAKSRVQRGRKLLKAELLSCCEVEYDHLGNVKDFSNKQSSCQPCS